MTFSRSRIFFATVAAAMTATATVGAGPAASAADTTASAAHPAPYPYADTAPSRSRALVPHAAAAACVPYVDGDDVHVSSGDVSGHGWWYRNTCANQKTTVTIYLYEYYSDNTWRWKNTGSKSVYPGGGSANRAAVRITCTGVVPAAWRTLVVVKIGAGASAYTKTLNLPCRNG